MTELALIAVVLGALLAAHLLSRGMQPVPPQMALPFPPPRLSVVIPARDEAQALPALLASLAASELVPHEVVVVDDDSRDATADVARAGGAAVVTPGPPPAGWTGKAWACQAGADATTGDLLLFLDADTVLTRPDALQGLVSLRPGQGGLVSVQPHHRTERGYEQLSAYFNLVSVLASDAFTRRRSSAAMAFGPCLLTARSDYAEVGGHRSVRGSVLDDVSLARVYQRAGKPVRVAVGGGSIAMRSYPQGLAQLVAGWSKNIASGAAATAPVTSLATVGWICVHHAVAVGLLVSTVRLALGEQVGTHPTLWLAAWVALALQMRSLLRRIGDFRAWTWWVFAIPLLAFDLIFVRSLLWTGLRRRVRWRGREVDLRGQVG